MARALELAERGRGSVSPNPLVGCVLVRGGKIIGEGWHRRYGAAHAEVNAIASVKDPEDLKDATAYVTLEPCAHTGKTPPCANLLIEKNIPRVVVGMQDPFAEVNGEGIRRLRSAGTAVKVGVLEEKCRELNARFLTFVGKKRPYIILKWAQTQDGFLAREDFSSKWISDAYSRQLTHKWRSEEDAIMVGTNTLRYDNPGLTVRDWVGRSPLRVVIDRKLISSARAYRLFDGSTPTFCYHEAESSPSAQKNVTYKRLKPGNTLPQILDDLYAHKVQSLFVEGGKHLHERFLESGLWDELRIFTAPHGFGSGIRAARPQGKCIEVKYLRRDFLSIYRNL